DAPRVCSNGRMSWARSPPVGRHPLGLLHEIGVADLRLNEQEARVLLQGAGVELDSAEVAELTGRTEGWPPGLYLPALSLQAGAPGPARGPGRPGAPPRPSRTWRGRRRSDGVHRNRTSAPAPPRHRRPCGGGTGAARAPGSDVERGWALGDA